MKSKNLLSEDKMKDVIEKNFGLSYRDAHFSNIIFDKEMEKQGEILLEWSKNPSGILLYLGTPGCGKGRYCASFCRSLLEAGVNEYHFMFLKEQRFFQRLQNTMNPDSFTNVDEQLRIISSVPYLIYDDFGVCKDTDWREENSFSLLDMRCDNQKPMIFTSNLFLEDLKEKMEPRLYSRITGIRNTVVEVRRGPDYRQVF